MRRASALAAMAALTILGAGQPAFAQSSDELKALRKEVETLKDGQTSIQRDLQEIKRLLQTRPAAQAAPSQEIVLNLDGAQVKGTKTAKVTLVEFTDYQ